MRKSPSPCLVSALLTALLGACSSSVSGGPSDTNNPDNTDNANHEDPISDAHFALQPAASSTWTTSADREDGLHLLSDDRNYYVVDNTGQVVRQMAALVAESPMALVPGGEALFVQRRDGVYSRRFADGTETQVASATDVSINTIKDGRVIYWTYGAGATVSSMDLDGTNRRDYPASSTWYYADARGHYVYTQANKLLDDANTLMPSITTLSELTGADASDFTTFERPFDEVVVASSSKAAVFADLRGTTPTVTTLQPPFGEHFATDDACGDVVLATNAKKLVMRRPGQADVTLRTTSGTITSLSVEAPGDIVVWTEDDGAQSITYVARLEPATLHAIPVSNNVTLGTVAVSFVPGEDFGVLVNLESGYERRPYRIDFTAGTSTRLSDLSFEGFARVGAYLYASNLYASGTGLYVTRIDQADAPLVAMAGGEGCMLPYLALMRHSALFAECDVGVEQVIEETLSAPLTRLDLDASYSSYLEALPGGWVAFRGEIRNRPSAFMSLTVAHQDGALVDMDDKDGHITSGQHNERAYFASLTQLVAMDLATGSLSTVLEGTHLTVTPIPPSSSNAVMLVLDATTTEYVGYWVDVVQNTVTEFMRHPLSRSSYPRAVDLGDDNFGTLVGRRTEDGTGDETLLFTVAGDTSSSIVLPVDTRLYTLTHFTAADGSRRYLGLSDYKEIVIMDAAFQLLAGPTVLDLASGDRLSPDLSNVVSDAGRLYFEAQGAGVISIDENAADLQVVGACDSVLTIRGHHALCLSYPENLLFTLDLTSSDVQVLAEVSQIVPTETEGGVLIKASLATRTALMLYDAASAELRDISEANEEVVQATYAKGRALYSASTDGTWATYNIYLYDLTTGERRALFSTPPAFSIGMFSFDVDGTAMLYTASNVAGTSSSIVAMGL